MNSIFLSSEWISAVAEDYRLARACPINLSSGQIYAREFNILGFKQWHLYAEIDQNPIEVLLELFAIGKRKNIFMIDSHFNMARWQDIEQLQQHVQITETFGTYMIDLCLTEEELWSKLHSKHRNVIRRAIREGVEVRYELDLNHFEQMLDQTYARGQAQNRFGLSHLQSITRHLRDRMIVAGAYHEEKLQAAIMVPFDSQRGYYLHGATAQENILGASNLLHWEIMKNLKTRGVQQYDLGGARETTDNPRLQGIFRFKKRFGGDFVECYYWQKVLNPTAYALYKKLSTLRKGWR